MDFDRIRRLPNDDQRIASLAAPNGDVVSDWQLRCIGIDRWKVQRRVARGVMRPVTAGEYLVGPSASRPMNDRTRRGLAIVHAGAGPVALARATASAQYGVLDRGDGTIHVVLDRHVRDLPQHRIVYHRSQSFTEDDVRMVGGEPTTDFTTTIVSLGFDHTRYQIARAICAGRDQGRLDLHAIASQLDGWVGRPGTREVRAALTLVAAGCNGSRGRCEDLLIDEVAASRILPIPDVCNRRAFGLGGIEPDLAWNDVGLAIFADGRPHTWVDIAENDAQQMELMVQHDVVALRFANREIWRNSGAVVETIEQAYLDLRNRRRIRAVPSRVSPAGPLMHRW